MGKRREFLLVIAVLLFLPVQGLAAPEMKEGLWEITSQLDMPGMPMQIPAHTFRHCMTKDNMVPQQQSPNQDCKLTSSKTVGNTVHWHMECKTPQGPSVIDGEVTYSDNSMQGVTRMKQSGMDMTQRMSGRRIGPCQ